MPENAALTIMSCMAPLLPSVIVRRRLADNAPMIAPRVFAA
jgi:hypothetical protein